LDYNTGLFNNNSKNTFNQNKNILREQGQGKIDQKNLPLNVEFNYNYYYPYI
jgi:hypothetical protein